MISRDVLDNGLRVVTETIPHVRSVSVGVWLTRGSRHESPESGGIAHFVEHMLFKGTLTRSAEDIAQAIDSIGGQMDAFTAKEYASYYLKVLDEHLPMAFDVLADIVLNPALTREDVEKEKKVVLEEIKMVEDTPDDLVHELFVQSFWQGHPLGRPILGEPDTVASFTPESLRGYFGQAYVAPNLIIAAAGNVGHEEVCDHVMSRFGRIGRDSWPVVDRPPTARAQVVTRVKDLEQAHLCLGTPACSQAHEDRYVTYVLNTMLGGSMSSRLFQNIREKQGLAYSVFSNFSSYRDAGSISVYAGCAAEAVPQVVNLVVSELKGMKRPVPEAELRRAREQLKGSLMLSLENTSSRMSHLARQEIYFDRQFGLDETIAGVERVTIEDLERVAAGLFVNGSVTATILGPQTDFELTEERLDLG